MAKILELQNVYAGYNDNVILKNVSLEINERDFIGVIGPNGGGKTTLVKLILGILSPMEGKVVYYESEKDQSNFEIGYLPQIHDIDYRFPISVTDVILSGTMGFNGIFKRPSKKDKERANELLEGVGLYSYKNKQVGELSGGQLQKVFLCRALISAPQLLILDEPNTFVDNKFEGELYDYLKRLNEEIAILMVSHDLGTISSYIKSIACVNRELHFHNSNLISDEQLASYDCPIQVITHGSIPHTVLKQH